VRELSNKEVAHRTGMSQGLHLHRVGYTVVWVGLEVTHDKISNLRQRGLGGGQLRHELRARFGMIYHQEGINDSKVGGMLKFKFKRCYKTLGASHKTTLSCLRI